DAQELKTISEVEKEHIQRVLLHASSLEEAARTLGIDPATLWRKRKKYHLG
ncbi:MAG: helix-turn-helix domain-containing protein, partial [Thermodesulfobacteriota bacterium]